MNLHLHALCQTGKLAAHAWMEIEKQKTSLPNARFRL